MNRTILINYADARFAGAQRLNAETGRRAGGFDEVRCFGPADLDPDWARQHEAILSQRPGGGYWLWKPYLILRTLREMPEDAYLFYSDAGCIFLRRIDPLIETARRLDQAVVFFENMRVERRWTKRDALVRMGCDEPKYTDSPQRQGSFSLWRKCAAAVSFAEEFLHWAEDPCVITDQENTCGLPNYPDFIHHRHDQSISSLLAKKHGLLPLRMISQYGQAWRREFPDCRYPQLVYHHRRGHLSLRKRLWMQAKARLRRGGG